MKKILQYFVLVVFLLVWLSGCDTIFNSDDIATARNANSYIAVHQKVWQR
jgi:uncharacterized protein YceK